ncbi:hypothetical protein, partial [Mesorhizobium sp. M7A.F.Ca.CA.002.06.1.1]|uniref:hypothetical protein n=1 Tax=Mesorhizobium sp. M7A.F.Ca.CA.002.06.1.1 TaxID=2496705 RepID=UPI0019D0FB7E
MTKNPAPSRRRCGIFLSGAIPDRERLKRFLDFYACRCPKTAPHLLGDMHHGAKIDQFIILASFSSAIDPSLELPLAL